MRPPRHLFTYTAWAWWVASGLSAVATVVLLIGAAALAGNPTPEGSPAELLKSAAGTAVGAFTAWTFGLFAMNEATR